MRPESAPALIRDLDLENPDRVSANRYESEVPTDRSKTSTQPRELTRELSLRERSDEFHHSRLEFPNLDFPPPGESLIEIGVVAIYSENPEIVEFRAGGDDRHVTL